MPRLLALGYGDSAGRVARALLRRGWTVTGTRTDEEGAEAAQRDGAQAIVYDGSGASVELSREIGVATHVLVSAPPTPEGDPFLLHHRGELEAAPAVEWVGYLSTTGVYGDRDGEWIDESVAPAPGSPRTRRRLEAEEGWREVARSCGARIQIFRLSGIYGPGRSQLDRLRSGSARRIVRPGLVFNRIHVDDVAGAVLAGIDHPSAEGAFNVTDDRPAPPEEVVLHAAALLDVEPPPRRTLEEAELSPMGRRFYEENKRVRNDRLKEVLGYRLQYPTYREGLAALLGPGKGSSGT